LNLRFDLIIIDDVLRMHIRAHSILFLKTHSI
jgi:hypothetical protein